MFLSNLHYISCSVGIKEQLMNSQDDVKKIQIVFFFNYIKFAINHIIN